MSWKWSGDDPPRRPVFHPYVPPRHHDLSPGGYVDLPSAYPMIEVPDEPGGIWASDDAVAHLRGIRGLLWGLLLVAAPVGLVALVVIVFWAVRVWGG